MFRISLISILLCIGLLTEGRSVPEDIFGDHPGRDVRSWMIRDIVSSVFSEDPSLEDLLNERCCFGEVPPIRQDIVEVKWEADFPVQKRYSSFGKWKVFFGPNVMDTEYSYDRNSIRRVVLDLDLYDRDELGVVLLRRRLQIDILPMDYESLESQSSSGGLSEFVSGWFVNDYKMRVRGRYLSTIESIYRRGSGKYGSISSGDKGPSDTETINDVLERRWVEGGRQKSKNGSNIKSQITD